MDPNRNFYLAWKSIYDSVYRGTITARQARDKLVELLVTCGTKLRPNDHKLLGTSYFVYDKEKHANLSEKPLGIGFVYEKPNGTNTQDIFIVSPSGNIERFYSEKEIVKEYPSMRGSHKDNLPI